MGVIKRQGIKQSLVNYFAVGIAAISTVFIYPLDTEAYGLARFVIDVAFTLSPLIMLGFGAVTIKFFPLFRDEEKNHNGFLFFILSGGAVGSILIFLIAFIFKNQIQTLYAHKELLFQKYLFYVFPLGVFVAFLFLLTYYSSNFKRIVVPALFQNLIKITLPVTILLYYTNTVSVAWIVNGILLTYLLAVIGMLVYIFSIGQLKLKPDFSLLNKERVREIRTYALYGLFGTLGSVLAFKIDSFMISSILNFESNGAYAIAAFIGNALAIPTGAIIMISGPIISDSFKRKDMVHIKFLYKSSSLNLLIIGLLLFVLVAISIEDLFSIMPNNKNLTDGVVIVLLIGCARIVDMGTSVNNQIINYSKYFRFGFYAIILMSIFNIIANLILIPKFQIIGAALATLLSLSLYNLVKMIFIQWKFKMHPFSRKTIVIVVVAGFFYFLGMWIPSTENAILNILVRSILIGAGYVSLVFYLKISEDFNGILENAWQRVRQFF